MGLRGPGRGPADLSGHRGLLQAHGGPPENYSGELNKLDRDHKQDFQNCALTSIDFACDKTFLSVLFWQSKYPQPPVIVGLRI